MINLKDYKLYMIDFVYTQIERDHHEVEFVKTRNSYNVIAKSSAEAVALVRRKFGSKRDFLIEDTNEAFISTILYEIPHD